MNLCVAFGLTRPPRGGGWKLPRWSAFLGRHYLSNANCLMRPRLLYAVFKDHHHLLHDSPLLKNACVRQVALDEWFPLSSSRWPAASSRCCTGPSGAAACPRRGAACRRSAPIILHCYITCHIVVHKMLLCNRLHCNITVITMYNMIYEYTCVYIYIYIYIHIIRSCPPCGWRSQHAWWRPRSWQPPIPITI